MKGSSSSSNRNNNNGSCLYVFSLFTLLVTSELLSRYHRQKLKYRESMVMGSLKVPS